MLFNSLDFAIFLPLVFLLYWGVTGRSRKAQNVLIVAASYVFYGWWDWRFLFLLIFSSLLDYTIGLALPRTNRPRMRKLLLGTSLVANLGLLGLFKYFNFFIENFTTAFSFFGQSIPIQSLNIILPVGISFYTFQTLSYTIDIYRREMEPTRDPIAFMAFVGFFPQLVAGPIERARNLLPQFLQSRHFSRSQAVDGLRQMLWGLFKKMVIADNCAIHANEIFSQSDQMPGSVLLLGAVFFAFQIYGDFSGYSDIAIGTARLLGFRLTQNFATPYFSRDIAEFWRRWHITLTTWFRDYVYIPLGGSRRGTAISIRNLFLVFLVSGFWHGANWTFLAWGALNAAYFLPLMLWGRNRKHLRIVAEGRRLPSLRDLGLMGSTFLLTLPAWILFRSANLTQAFSILKTIGSRSLLILPAPGQLVAESQTLLLIGFFMSIEWIGRETPFALSQIGVQWRRPARWLFYAFLLFLIGLFAPTDETPFIYFQF